MNDTGFCLNLVRKICFLFDKQSNGMIFAIERERVNPINLRARFAVSILREIFLIRRIVMRQYTGFFMPCYEKSFKILLTI